jgi:protein-S-isoprenylcysteine O-methyltransferase Ste14
MVDADKNGADVKTPQSVLPVMLKTAGFGLLLFVAAGRLNWVAGWLFLAANAITTAASYAYINRVNPGLMAKRARVGKGTKTWDKFWLVVFILLSGAVYLVAALDAGRYGWSEMSFYLWPPGCVVFFFAAFITAWSMGVNPFFEKTVRIQSESDHRVIDAGPYRFARHPGYIGIIGVLVSVPLMLGSWWALIPSALSVIAIIIRTAFEDRTLREELPGYVEYAARVRFRLFPMIW